MQGAARLRMPQPAPQSPQEPLPSGWQTAFAPQNRSRRRHHGDRVDPLGPMLDGNLPLAYSL
jgi:hypothetical protein